jgi:hypothetical protein
VTGAELSNHALHLLCDFTELVAALNALVKVSDALLDIGTVHVFLVDLSAAPMDDLVRDFCEELLHLIVTVVEA